MSKVRSTFMKCVCSVFCCCKKIKICCGRRKLKKALGVSFLPHTCYIDSETVRVRAHTCTHSPCCCCQLKISAHSYPHSHHCQINLQKTLTCYRTSKTRRGCGHDSILGVLPSVVPLSWTCYQEARDIVISINEGTVCLLACKNLNHRILQVV